MNAPASGTTPRISFFLQKHSALLRLWHWLTFLVMTASMITVLLGSTTLRTRNNITLVQEQLKTKGAVVTADQARAVAHEYSDKMWMWHKYLGYGLAILLLSRMLIEFTQPGDEKFRHRMRNAMALRKHDEVTRAGARHYLFVKISYLAFYVLLLVMALTGLSLAYDDDVPLLRTIHRPVSTLHEAVQYTMYAFVFFHLCGVILADLGKDKGIVSGMINGNDEHTADQQEVVRL